MRSMWSGSPRRTAILALVAVAVCYWLCTALRSRVSVNAGSNQNAAVEQTAEQPKSNREPHATLPKPSQTSMEKPIEREHEARLLVESMNVPIQFYGRVVDQDDLPLAGAVIRARIRGWHVDAALNADGHFHTQQATSGIDGRFEISGGRGDVLTIEAVEREGFAPEPESLRSFGYNISTNITPARDKPVVFRMWRQDIKEDLITGSKFFGITPDGRVYTIDLFNGTISESSTGEGDFRVWVKRPDGIQFGEKYAWSMGIEVIDGGVIENPDDNSPMYLAPEQGYMKDYTFSMEDNARRWDDMIKKRFYITTRSRRAFGRIDVDVYAFYDLIKRRGAFGVKYSVNPSGSRVLR